MTKRSALMLAAGLAIALLIGVAAISLSLGDPSVAHAGGHRKPVVHHRVQTVTIHKKAPSTGGAQQPVEIVHVGSAAPTAATSTSGGYGEPESGDASESDDAGNGPSSAGAYGDD